MDGGGNDCIPSLFLLLVDLFGLLVVVFALHHNPG